jgi:diguanylate cyclase (GGDEF)-like protein
MGKLFAIALTLLSSFGWSLLSYYRHGSWPPWYIEAGGSILYLAIGLWVGHLYDQVAYLSRRDPLTGLYNRRLLWQELLRHLALAQRQQAPVALLLIDVDDFKHGINDRLGHLIGDQVLEQVAGAIRQSTRRQDVAGRWGGEEFAVIAPKTTPAEAFGLAEQIRQRVAQQTEPPVTVSIGVASFPREGADAATLMRLADEALYAAKRIKNATVASASRREMRGTR